MQSGQVNSFRSSAELLAELLRDQAAVLSDIVRQSTARADVGRGHAAAGSRLDQPQRTEFVAALLVRLQRLLAPEPAALFRLLSRPPAWLSEVDLRDLRQATEEFAAAVVDSGALSDRLKLLQEELAALVSEHTNRTLFILTLVTVLALPINVVAGLLGMNVGGIPLSQHRQGFLLMVLALSVTTGLLAYYLLLKRHD